jgi:hypothetical protein
MSYRGPEYVRAPRSIAGLDVEPRGPSPPDSPCPLRQFIPDQKSNWYGNALSFPGGLTYDL